MTIKSKMWGVGWLTSGPQEAPKKQKRPTRESEARMFLKNWPSIPGRTARQKAIYLLQIAAEVEHALMVQYLYAAYSLDEAFEQSRGNQTTAIVDKWKRDIRSVARQEMAHFVTVQNLLISLGAEVYVSRENNFSDHPDAYPFPVRFEKFGLGSVALYVAAERPDESQIEDPKTKALLNRILKLVDKESVEKVNRVGVLYAALYWLFLRNDDANGPWEMPESMKYCMRQSGLEHVHVKENDFVSGDEYEEFAATPNEWEVYEDTMHVDDGDPRSRALRAIYWIMLQGEGAGGLDCNQTDSHFCKFLNIYIDLTKNPLLAGAARNVPVNPIVLGTHRTEVVHPASEAITHPEARLWAQLFNTRYQMLLLDVLLALSTSRTTNPVLRSELTKWAARHEMEHLKQIGQLLPNLPRERGGSSHRRAGPPFEIVQFPADDTKRWDQQRVLIKGSQQLVERLKPKISPQDHRFALLQSIEEFDQERTGFVEKQAKTFRAYDWKAGNLRIKDQ